MIQPDKHGINYYIDPQEEKRLERLKTLKHRATQLMAHAAITLTAFLGVYAADAMHGEQVQAEASVSVSYQGAPLNAENNDSALIFFNGFGTYDGDDLTEHLGEVAQKLVDGELWSMSYGNAPLSPEVMANEIIEKAKERGIKKISIVGYSAGGIIGIETLEYIVKNSNLIVEMIMPISTPAGIDSLRQRQQEEMKNAGFIAEVPGASHSTFVRFFGEMYFRRDRYDEGDLLQRANDLNETTFSVLDDLDNEKLAGTWLLIDQTIAIGSADLDERLKNISEATADRQTPVIVYFGTAEPGYDYLVDDKESSEIMCDTATKYTIQCFMYYVPGAVHSIPARAHEEYLETADQAVPSIEIALGHEELIYFIQNETIRTPIHH